VARYRLLSLLGAGGMGEVYLARDEALGRSVALKILPPELVRNEERVRRFVQEAKAASSLSHPHIVAIHEIGEAEVRPERGAEDAAGASAGPATHVHFIAMELVSGRTLRDLIHKDRTDLQTLVRHLAQAAEGLAKAHAAGIVHRDLKPENIMVSSDGYAKVLDFGLAKLTEAGGGADLTTAPTELARTTAAGVILGTVGYMSPEQVQGRTVDHRSDIFSFGCILYEAAARQRPFQADSDIETLHRILKERPAPLDELNTQVPGELRRLVRRCLAKSPDQLDGLFDGRIGSRLALVALADGRTSGLGTTRWRAVEDIAGLPDGSGLIVAGVGEGGDLDMNQAWLVSYPEGTGRRITNDTNGYGGGLSVSADGRMVAATQRRGAARLWMAPAENPGAGREVGGGAAGVESIFGLDATATSVLFSSRKGGRSSIWIVEADGTGRRVLTPDSLDAFGAIVSQQTRVVVFSATQDDGLPHAWRMDLDGDGLRQVTNGGGEVVAALSPNGQTLLLWRLEQSTTGTTVWRVPLSGGTPVKFLDGIDSVFGYSPDGRHLLVSARRRAPIGGSGHLPGTPLRSPARSTARGTSGACRSQAATRAKSLRSRTRTSVTMSGRRTAHACSPPGDRSSAETWY
jgi:hypothetical protein